MGKNILDSYKKLFANKATSYMLICSLFIAFGRITDKFVIQNVSPYVYALSLEFFISTFFFLFLMYKRKTGEIVKMVKEKPLLTLLMGSANAVSYIFLLFAFTKIEVSIAEPATMLGAVTAIILGKFYFKEKIKDRMVGALIMFAGTILLFV